MAPATHRPEEPSEVCLGYPLPLQLQLLEEDVTVGCRRVVLPDTSSQDIPDVFDKVHIGRDGWPYHPCDIICLNKVIHNESAMTGCIIVHEHSVGSNSLQRRDGAGSHPCSE